MTRFDRMAPTSQAILRDIGARSAQPNVTPEAAVRAALATATPDAIATLRTELPSRTGSKLRAIGMGSEQIAALRTNLARGLTDVATSPTLGGGPEIDALVQVAIAKHVQTLLPLAQSLLAASASVDAIGAGQGDASQLAAARAEVERVRGQVLDQLATLDAKPGQLEAGLGMLIDTLAQANKAPVGLVDKKEATVQLAAEAVRAATWVNAHPSYASWAELEKALTQQVTATRRAGDGSLLKDATFRAELAAISGGEIVGGNRVTPLADGPTFLKELLDLIDHCEGPLLMEYWAIYDDPTGPDVADRLAARDAAGRPTILIVDGDVALREHHGRETIPRLEALSNVEVIRFDDPEMRPVGSHCKGAIDLMRLKSVSGGSNVGSLYTGFQEPNAWTDKNSAYEGPVVLQQVAHFEAMRQRHIAYGGATKFGADFVTRNTPVADRRGGVEAAFLENVPMETHNLLAGNLAMMEGVGAGETFTINHCYFLMNEPTEAAVRRLAQRGGKLDLYLNTPDNIDEPSVAAAILTSARRALQIFESEGRGDACAVYLKQGPMMHNKLAIAGDQLVREDTWNWHPRSETLEFETGYLVCDEGVAKQQLASLEAMKANGQFVKVDRAADIEIPPQGAAAKLLAIFWNVL